MFHGLGCSVRHPSPQVGGGGTLHEEAECGEHGGHDPPG